MEQCLCETAAFRLAATVHYSSFAFKAFSIADALKAYETVLWVDAGLVILRPLDIVKFRLSTDGHFSQETLAALAMG